MNTFIQANNSYETRVEKYDGKEYLVVPVIMMVEGVHAGSGGPMLHLAEDLGRYPETWNGIPVVVTHPSEDGQYISANSPEVLDAGIVGRVFNTKMDGEKLKSEVWLNQERLGEISPEALKAILEQIPLDVSVGVFSDSEAVTDIYKGEQYESIARNFRPDHLALLPGEEGACSWSDGCGIRANKNSKSKKKGGDDVKEETSQIIVEKEKRSGLTRTKFNSNNSKKGGEMSEEKKTPCCEDLVNELIANKRTTFEEKDKEQLLTLSEDLLAKLIPEKEEVKKVEPKVEKEPEVLTKVEPKPVKTEPITMEKYLETVPADIKDQVVSGLALHKAQRVKMIETIKTNLKDVWSDEDLEAMDMVTLTKLSKSVPEIVDYSVNVAGRSTNNNEQEPLYPAGIEIETK